jgi:hypothetical protein
MIEQEMAEMPRPQLLEDQPMEQPKEKEWRPSKQECLRQYDISIRFLSRGCVVKVGCKEIPFEDVSDAMAHLNEYVAGDTYEVQKKWGKILD